MTNESDHKRLTCVGLAGLALTLGTVASASAGTVLPSANITFSDGLSWSSGATGRSIFSDFSNQNLVGELSSGNHAAGVGPDGMPFSGIATGAGGSSALANYAKASSQISSTGTNLFEDSFATTSSTEYKYYFEYSSAVDTSIIVDLAGLASASGSSNQWGGSQATMQMSVLTQGQAIAGYANFSYGCSRGTACLETGTTNTSGIKSLGTTFSVNTNAVYEIDLLTTITAQALFQGGEASMQGYVDPFLSINPISQPGDFTLSLSDGVSNLPPGLLSDSAVPEPAAWALMIGGFSLAGVALRRRRSVVAA